MEFDILETKKDETLGILYTLDTREVLGCVTAWTKDFLEIL